MKKIFDYNVLEIGNYSLSLFNALAIIVIILIVWIVLKIIKRILYRNTKLRQARQFATYQIFKYLVIIMSFILCLKLARVDVSAMLVGSAALLVGVGLGLQNLFNDFVSGVIILLDGSVEVNDIIEVNGLICKVQRINMRTTTVLARDDKTIILPNSTLTGSQLINWTHGHETARFEIQIGVDYTSDIHKAMNIIKAAADDHPMILKDPKPFVRLIDYGNSSVDLLLLFWSNEIFRVENIKSQVRIKIFDEFANNGITIPFPQRVVHLRNK